jgi:hypothetical protein
VLLGEGDQGEELGEGGQEQPLPVGHRERLEDVAGMQQGAAMQHHSEGDRAHTEGGHHVPRLDAHPCIVPRSL